MSKHICSGCLTYDTRIKPEDSHFPNECFETPIQGFLKCPCLDCIVKSMCESTCGKFYTFKNITKAEYHSFPGGGVNVCRT